MTNQVVFIHGAWVTPLCWELFEPFFQECGYQTIIPPWPGKEATITQQREDPSPALRGLGIGEIVDHYQRLITALPRPPILVGHSFGGLFVQLLLERGLGVAGVAIDSAPPKGIFAFYPSAIRSLFGVLTTWMGWRRILRMPLADFKYAFVNTLPAERQRAVYDRYVVPETGRIFFQVAVSLTSPHSPAKVRFDNASRAPLLLVAGGSDHIVPPAINRSNYRKYRHTSTITEFKQFPGRGHWIIAEDGWEEVAGFIYDWLRKLPGLGSTGPA